MNSFSWKKIIPHVIAIAVFLIVALVYCSPALEGKVLQQTDIVHWKGTAQDAFNYKAQHGHFPLWNTHSFSGMPNYLIAMEGHSLLPNLQRLMQFYLPQPAAAFFMACLCFYILCMAYSMNVWVAILGALGFAYATYNPIIISVGHETKMAAISYMPGLMAGLVLLYRKRYVIGLMVTALFATLEIGAGHPQVTYYLLMTLGIMTVAYIIKWIVGPSFSKMDQKDKTRLLISLAVIILLAFWRIASGDASPLYYVLLVIVAFVIAFIWILIRTKGRKRDFEFRHMFIALSLAALGGLIGIGNSALSLLTTYEYTKYSIRGSKGIDVTGGDTKQAQTSGLDESYAFSYSLGMGEALVLMMPNAYGASSAQHLDPDSKVISALTAKNVPEGPASQLAANLPKYWGGISPFTSGPPYSGALICFLAVIGFAVTRGVSRWWILAATVFTIFIAWGSYFIEFNKILFDYLPMYNKFRAPSMALIIPQLLLPLMATIGLQRIFFEPDGMENLKKNFKNVLYAAGGLFGVALLVYLFNDFSGSIDGQIVQAYAQQAGEELAHTIISGMKEDRKAMFIAGLGHALWIGLLVLIALFLYQRNTVKPTVILAVFIFVNMADLLIQANKYLNKENYQDELSYQSNNFAFTTADQQILQDKDAHYRVLNLASGDPFTDAVTSYHHRSVGGYHAAKLRIYQDVLENQFSRKDGGLNMNVLNMLDTRYVITPSRQEGQPAGAAVQRNPDALGACWFVKNIRYTNGPVETIKSLSDFNPKDTAIVDASFKAAAPEPVFDSAASIKLVSYDNDDIKYATNAASNQFAVLSEVYYPAGWNAYIDGKKTAYASANYILRGISVPAGQHTIEFKFEPTAFYTGQKLVYIANVLLWLSIAASIFIFWKQQRKTA
ncbi:YfhO family protein [Chitinophaga tropicalis]|uniref:YfhO family protein n=1 Tax=Chitinophaga tropicalis TaxID=2683588 RepID=A0A7K1U470_9BACT|nr:YfhO family protein [Chitinophaga tropicalis]MVT09151.1 YfhO family protein [Chitinophaga tropicalis]